MLKLPRTNIEIQLQKVRNRRTAESNIMARVKEIFDQEAIKEEHIIQKLTSAGENHINIFDFDLLESGRIYHLSDIEKICIDYRLRFLDSSYFKAEIPIEAISEIKKLEKQHQTSLKGFKIIAPSKLLKLDNADDPLLFAPMGNNYFYLIHKWGNDLHPLRKILMWPFKYIENFVLVLLICSLLLALMVPDGLFSPKQTTTQFFIIFFFVFKWIAGLSIFYGVKFGKNFNSTIWQSRYYNA